MLLQYRGEPGRYYAGLALAPEPGEVYELDADPGDGRWSSAPDGTDAVAFQTEVPEAAAAQENTDDESDSDAGPYPDSEE